MFITCGGPDGDLIERDPTFRVLLAVILPELFELEVSQPYDLSEMRSEQFEAWGACSVSYWMQRMFSWA
jgi:hypothetical protein